MKDRKELEQNIRKNKDKIYSWKITHNQNNNVYIRGCFDYEWITFDDETDLIDDNGIKFYTDDSYGCFDLPINPFKEDFEDNDELERFDLFEELKTAVLSTSDVFWFLFYFDEDYSSFIDNDVFTMRIEED